MAKAEILAKEPCNGQMGRPSTNLLRVSGLMAEGIMRRDGSARISVFAFSIEAGNRGFIEVEATVIGRGDVSPKRAGRLLPGKTERGEAGCGSGIPAYEKGLVEENAMRTAKAMVCAPSFEAAMETAHKAGACRENCGMFYAVVGALEALGSDGERLAEGFREKVVGATLRNL